MNDSIHMSFCSQIRRCIYRISLEIGVLGPRVNALTIYLSFEFISVSSGSGSHGTWTLYSVSALLYGEILGRHFLWVSGQFALLECQTYLKAVINPLRYAQYKASIPLEITFYEKDLGYFYNQTHTNTSFSSGRKNTSSKTNECTTLFGSDG